MASAQKRSVIIAIDFGTTYSGIGYIFTDATEEHVYVFQKWGHGQGVSFRKTHTALLLKPDGSFFKFGHAAVQAYAKQATSKGDCKKLLFFERFKLLLHTESGVNENTEVRASNGKMWPALDVFAHCLRYLKDVGLDAVNGKYLRSKTVNPDAEQLHKPENVQWVVTVPAIWSMSAKQFMRSAAYKAGIGSSEDPDQLILALEPEAASYYCRNLPMNMFLDQIGGRKVKDTLEEEGVPYMVIDNGGGTLDVTVHEIRKDGIIVEKHCPTGGVYGGIHVDKEFELMMERAFGSIFIDAFKKDFPHDWLRIMSGFEVHKRAEPLTDDDEISIPLPPNFENTFKHDFGQDEDALNKKIRKSFGDKLSVSSGYLNISMDLLAELHQPIVSKIVEHVNDLVGSSVAADVKTIFLVGGFSESQFLKREMAKAFKYHRLMIPQDPELAIINGAVQFASNPGLLRARVVGKSYGVEINPRFDPQTHLEAKKIMFDGKEHCDDYFKVLILENERIDFEEVKSFSFCPTSHLQTSCSFHFYSTNNKLKEVNYTTDDGMIDERVQIELPCPDTTKGLHRKFKLKVYFGGTEITAKATDIETGNTVDATLKLVSKPTVHSRYR